MERFAFKTEVLREMEASPVPFAVYQFLDKRVVTLALSAGFCALFGFADPAEAYYVMDNDMYRDTHPEEKGRLAEAAMAFALEGGEYNVIYRTRAQTPGDWILVHAQGRHIFPQPGVRLAYVWYTDEGRYADSEAPEEGLSALLREAFRNGSAAKESRYDGLTGLPNMSFFFELAEEGLRRLRREGRPAAVLFLDLCGMKRYNRKNGFAEGDRLIREFARKMASFFGSENCTRIGQDHFALFAEDRDIERKLIRFFTECETLNGKKTLPVRAGIYRAGLGEVKIGRACDWAKLACDVNRKTRVSCFRYFDEGMLQETEMRQYIVDNLDRALAEGWVQAYYQPIVRAGSGRVCDEEALSRWIDPVKGFLSPADFIPALEDARLIWKLDLYMVDRILEKMKEQAEKGFYVVPVSVNLSRVDFDCCDVVEEIRRRVDEAGIERRMLTIEITESVVGKNFSFMKSRIERFRELGFRVWMDDFGSGYSTLDVLHQIRFDLIKLDMRFMERFGEGDENRIILTELIKMAIGLGLETVCEGVETEEQAEFLREIGCTKLQGYYFSRPNAQSEIYERYRRGTAIGFENPEESGYYAAVGHINLYDLSAIANTKEDALRHYFSTLPTAILEVNETRVRYMRANESYKVFIKNAFGVSLDREERDCSAPAEGPGRIFLSTLLRCAKEGGRAMIDEELDESTVVHALVKRVAVNPVTGTAAVAVAVLAVIDQSELRKAAGGDEN